MTSSASAVINIKDASLQFGSRTVWNNLSLQVFPGEFIAVLGPNGSGKTSLLKVLLGLLPLSMGEALVNEKLPGTVNTTIGYIPQQKNFDPGLPIRGRDLVGLGINGHLYGLRHNSQKSKKQISQAIQQVGAENYANSPIGLLSGGEQQRLRIAQAIVGQPSLLLCDEPLLSLDLASQQSIINLIHNYQNSSSAAVIFVTHEINPILPWVDRVLYFAQGRWVIDTPNNVLQANCLSDLYGTPIEVLRIKDRVLVLGAEDIIGEAGAHHGEHA